MRIHRREGIYTHKLPLMKYLDHVPCIYDRRCYKFVTEDLEKLDIDNKRNTEVEV